MDALGKHKHTLTVYTCMQEAGGVVWWSLARLECGRIERARRRGVSGKTNWMVAGWLAGLAGLASSLAGQECHTPWDMWW